MVENLPTINHFWIMVLRKEANLLISLRHIVLFDVNFQLHSIQTLLNAFAYPTWVIWITSARSSLCSNLAYMSRGMAPIPHVVMPKSWRMWLKANLTNVYYKSTWSLSSRNVCLLVIIIAFCSLQRNRAQGLLKTHAFIATWFWTLGPYSQVPGCSGLLDSMVTLWCVRKWHTKVVLGCIRCIALINVINKFWPNLCLVHILYGNQENGNHIWNQKNINIKPNVKMNIMDEGYAMQDEGYA